MKPFIGVTSVYMPDSHTLGVLDTSPDKTAWSMICNYYIHSVEKAGGIPVLLPLYDDPADACAVLAKLDGLLFTGGADIEPAVYGAWREEHCGPSVPERDTQEIALMQAALATDLPVFGICRGAQLLNAGAGGTLYQDLVSAGLPDHRHHCNYPEITQRAAILKGTLLHEIVGKDEIPVNSFHHQAVRTVAPGWMINAYDPECAAVTEGIELPSRRAFTLAVQWHPEALSDTEESSAALFRAFVDAASGRSF